MAKTVISKDGREYVTISCALCGVITARYNTI
jgi:hypothetical protein